MAKNFPIWEMFSGEDKNTSPPSSMLINILNNQQSRKEGGISQLPTTMV